MYDNVFELAYGAVNDKGQGAGRILGVPLRLDNSNIGIPHAFAYFKCGGGAGGATPQYNYVHVHSSLTILMSPAYLTYATR